MRIITIFKFFCYYLFIYLFIVLLRVITLTSILQQETGICLLCMHFPQVIAGAGLLGMGPFLRGFLYKISSIFWLGWHSAKLWCHPTQWSSNSGILTAPLFEHFSSMSDRLLGLSAFPHLTSSKSHRADILTYYSSPLNCPRSHLLSRALTLSLTALKSPFHSQQLLQLPAQAAPSPLLLFPVLSSSPSKPHHSRTECSCFGCVYPILCLFAFTELLSQLHSVPPILRSLPLALCPS